MTLSGGQAASTLEDIGALSGQGIVVVTVNAGAAGNTGTTLQANSLARVDRGQFLFRGNNASFGSAPGLQRRQPDLRHRSDAGRRRGWGRYHQHLDHPVRHRWDYDDSRRVPTS